MCVYSQRRVIGTYVQRALIEELRITKTTDTVNDRKLAKKGFITENISDCIKYLLNWICLL